MGSDDHQGWPSVWPSCSQSILQRSLLPQNRNVSADRMCIIRLDRRMIRRELVTTVMKYYASAPAAPCTSQDVLFQGSSAMHAAFV